MLLTERISGRGTRELLAPGGLRLSLTFTYHGCPWIRDRPHYSPNNDGETKPVSTEELSALTFASATLLFAKHSYAVLQGGRAGVAKS
jgi:hypothetical protein